MQEGKKILYLSYDGMTDPLGQSQVLPYLKGLSEKGYKFTLVSFEKAGVYEKGKDRIAALCREAGIRWEPLLYTKTPPVISTLKDVQAMKQKAWALHREMPFDIVHCRSYIAALAGLWLKKKTGVKFVFDMRGFWADERVDGGLWNLKNPLFKTVYTFFKKEERKFLQQADGIVSLTYAGRDEINTWGLKTPEITVIPCCVDTNLFDPEKVSDTHALRNKLGIPQKATVLGYVGSLGTWYELPRMMDFFRVWQQTFPESIFLFVTVEPREMILEAAREAGIPETALRITSSARADMPQYIAAMDYGMFFLKQAYSKKASSPVKQGELMAMGLPVICNAGVGDSDKIIQDYDAGVLVSEYTEEAYRKATLEIKAGVFDRTKVRAGAIEYFDLKKGIDTYAGVYRKLTGE